MEWNAGCCWVAAEYSTFSEREYDVDDLGRDGGREENII